jgi:hypothetical protein
MDEEVVEVVLDTDEELDDVEDEELEVIVGVDVELVVELGSLEDGRLEVK